MALEIPQPTPAAPIESNRRGRAPSDEPNPFLDEGWLWAQYEAVAAAVAAKEDPSGLTLSVTVPGGWEERHATNRQKEPLYDAETGEPVMTSVLVGDAATVVRLIRKAADLSEIGVSIQTVQAKTARGKDITGMVEVKYLAKERTIKGKKDNAAE